MDKSQLQISFIVTSINLYSHAISQVKTSDMIKLNITQKPLKQKQEYIINRLQGLYDINHEFKIVCSPSAAKKITLSIRKVEKKWCLENLFIKNQKNIDPLTGKPTEKDDPNIQYKYEQLANSLLGICDINIENLEIGVNNIIKADIMNSKDLSIVGEANFKIYKWNDELQFLTKKNDDKFISQILFEDPECCLCDK